MVNDVEHLAVELHDLGVDEALVEVGRIEGVSGEHFGHQDVFDFCFEEVRVDGE